MSSTSARAPTHLQPRLKAVATSVIIAQTAAATSESPSRPTTPLSRSSRQVAQIDPLSDKATSSLIRRTLCPNSGSKDTDVLQLLPPLTSSNEVDLQLYAIIAIIIKEFVLAWYGKITEDKVFVEEAVRIIAHCTRDIESRLRKIDLEALIFDELPELLDAHVTAYRTAFHNTHPPPLQVDPRAIYHSLWPTPALSPVPDPHEPSSGLIQKENEAAYRQLLVEGILTILLPTEDLENGCLTALVGQIFSEMIVGNGLGGKACEPWLLWEAITKVAELTQSHLPQAKAQTRLDRSSSFTLKLEGVDEASMVGRSVQPSLSMTLQKMFWLVLQYAFLAFTTLQVIIETLLSSSSLPNRSVAHTNVHEYQPVVPYEDPPTSSGSNQTFDSINTMRTQFPIKRPILNMRIWSCASNLLDMNVRMPWVCALLSALQWMFLKGPGTVGATNGLIDKLLSTNIQRYVLDPGLIPIVLRSTRAAMFPNNAPGPARQPPTTPEQLEIRRRCAESILRLIPAGIKDIYWGKDDERRVQEVEETLDCFGDSYCNKHLVYALVELVVVRLCPDLARKGVVELWADRLD